MNHTELAKYIFLVFIIMTILMSIVGSQFINYSKEKVMQD